MKAIELNPTSWPALWVRGLAYHRLHRFEQASDDFAKVSTLNPDHEEVHLYLGHAHHNLGRYTEAINSLNKMIEINPQDPRAYYRRALTHQKLGRLIRSPWTISIKRLSAIAPMTTVITRGETYIYMMGKL